MFSSLKKKEREKHCLPIMPLFFCNIWRTETSKEPLLSYIRPSVCAWWASATVSGEPGPVSRASRTDVKSSPLVCVCVTPHVFWSSGWQMFAVGLLPAQLQICKRLNVTELTCRTCTYSFVIARFCRASISKSSFLRRRGPLNTVSVQTLMPLNLADSPSQLSPSCYECLVGKIWLIIFMFLKSLTNSPWKE